MKVFLRAILGRFFALFLCLEGAINTPSDLGRDVMVGVVSWKWGCLRRESSCFWLSSLAVAVFVGGVLAKVVPLIALAFVNVEDCDWALEVKHCDWSM